MAELAESRGLSLHDDGEGELWKGALAGAVGGLVGTVVMTKFQELEKHLADKLQESRGEKGSGNDGQAEEESERQGKPEEESDDATVKTAAKLAEKVFNHELTEEEKKLAGPAVHYTFGTLMGALYGGIAEAEPATARGAGLAFGTALWLAADEVSVPALGLAKKPTEYPVKVHASALGAHLVYGMTADLVRRLVRRALG